MADDTMCTKSELEILRDAISAAIEDLYKIGGVPRLFVNAELPGVVVPEHIRARFGTRLLIDLRPEYAMNLEHTEIGLEATLAFGGHTARCVFPWRAIFAITDAHTGVGIVIVAAVPPQVGMPTTSKPGPVVVPKPEPRPAEKEKTEEEIAEAKQHAKERLGLRLVKGGKA